jgi:LmbE family N-acetylglucosaminyl deacetylase
MRFKRIVVLAPHTDDAELGCGGTMARLSGEGAEAFEMAFSICEKSVPELFPEDILLSEVKKASVEIGVLPENLKVFRYPVRSFPHHRQEILENLIEFRTAYDPDLVFLPSIDDIHQDHNVIHKEGVRAFKNITMLGYEMPWNNIQFASSAFFRLDEKHLKMKLAAMAKYESQSKKTYMREEYIKSLAIMRGQQMGCEYAEAFQVIRWVER